MKYTPLLFESSAANCPHCGAYSSFEWSKMAVIKDRGFSQNYDDFHIAKCNHCADITIWRDIYDAEQYHRSHDMIYPIKGNTPLPNDDLPQDIKADYYEASTIVELSPRGAAALLRLAVQKLCKHLGEEGKNINSDIKSLVSKGLNPMIKMALDSVRVTGNYAVHPGSIDLKDDRETAIKLFGFINVIADVMITQPKNISEFYALKIPKIDKENIQKRDSK